jgi:hypothetical protein
VKKIILCLFLSLSVLFVINSAFAMSCPNRNYGCFLKTGKARNYSSGSVTIGGKFSGWEGCVYSNAQAVSDCSNPSKNTVNNGSAAWFCQKDGCTASFHIGAAPAGAYTPTL